jgi:ankyrin repeat protein
MKKAYVLSGIMVLNAITAIYAMETPKQRLDILLSQTNINWRDIMEILDSTPTLANEYRTPKRIAWSYAPLIVLAAAKKRLPIVEVLLKHNANPNLGDDIFETTALMIACANKDIPMINVLLKYGADPEQTNYEGLSSFDFAQNDPNVIKILNKSLKQRSRPAVAA